MRIAPGINHYFGLLIGLVVLTQPVYGAALPDDLDDSDWRAIREQVVAQQQANRLQEAHNRGGTFVQQVYVKASNTESDDNFGFSVAISGNTVVVGAPSEDSNATGVNGDQDDGSAGNSGAAYVFVRDPLGGWLQQAYLKASNTAANNFYGGSVAISGDTIVVGANGESSSATGVDGDQDDTSAVGAGAAYVYVRSGDSWSQQAYLKASNTDSGDAFGASVAVSGDTVVVGAPGEASNANGVDGDQDDNSADDSGAAYVFTRSGETWSQQAYKKASNPSTADRFASDVVIDGDTVVIGAPLESSSATGIDGDQDDNSANSAGAVYVFVRSGGSWSQQAYLKASNTGASDRFGDAIAISGDTVVVGAFAEDSNATGIDGDQDNDLAVNTGGAYVFVRSDATWSQQAYLKASTTDVNDQFGYSVAVSGDTLAVGARNESSSATGLDGDQDDDSANASGAVYLFERMGTSWSQQSYVKASNTGSSDRFGASVAASIDALVVGAPFESSDATGVDGDQNNDLAQGSGAVYVFSIPDYTIGGSVEGLAGVGLVLQNNGGDDLAIAGNGLFAFPTALPDGSGYIVTIQTQPVNPSQTCSVANGSGTLAGSDVTNIEVTCVTDQFTVGGTVSGLLGDQVVLQNDGGDDQPITADGDFTFAAQDDGTDYNVTVLTQPGNPSQTCSVANGTGTLSGADVADVEVTCSIDQFTVGGTVSGLEGDQVVLQNNGGDDQVLVADGNFTFAAQDDGTDYAVTVLAQPENPIQTCAVSNASGTLSGADVTAVQVDCISEPPEVELSAGTLDFGFVLDGESANASVTVTNSGTGELIISGLIEPSAPFAVAGGSCTALPVTLLPGETCEIDIVFTPETATGGFSDELTIVSNADSSPDTITLSGSAQPLVIPTLDRYGLLILVLLIGSLALRAGRSSAI